MRTVVAVWAVLTIVTVISWVLGAEHRNSQDNLHVTMTIVLVIAFVKVELVGRYFMELHSAPLRLRSAFDIWVATTFFAVLGLYLALG